MKQKIFIEESIRSQLELRGPLTIAQLANRTEIARRTVCSRLKDMPDVKVVKWEMHVKVLTAFYGLSAEPSVPRPGGPQKLRENQKLAERKTMRRAGMVVDVDGMNTQAFAGKSFIFGGL